MPYATPLKLELVRVLQGQECIHAVEGNLSRDCCSRTTRSNAWHMERQDGGAAMSCQTGPAPNASMDRELEWTVLCVSLVYLPL
jgi:hypothetical protein